MLRHSFQNDLITVVIPSHDRFLELDRALASLVSQTDPDFSVIVCDDGSIGDMHEVTDYYLDKLNLRLVRIEQTGGPAGPRNRCIAASTSEWISFLDSDDWWFPNRIKSIKAKLTEDIDIVYHKLTVFRLDGDRKAKFYPAGSCIGKRIKGIDYIASVIRYGNPFATSATVVRRSLLIRAGGFDESKELSSVEDYYLWIRLIVYHARIRFINESLGAYWVGFDNISIFSLRQFQRQKNLFKRVFSILPSKYHDLARSRFNYLLGSYCVTLNIADSKYYFNNVLIKYGFVNWIKASIKSIKIYFLQFFLCNDTSNDSASTLAEFCVDKIYKNLYLKPPCNITVLIPIFNRRDELIRALNSLVVQTDPYFNVIVCDDGSTEDIRGVVLSYSDKLQIKTIRIEKSGGPARPRNVGLHAATTEWVSLLDSDDWWYPQRIERVKAELSADVDVLYHTLIVHRADKNRQLKHHAEGTTIGRGLPNKDPLRHMINNGNPLVTSATILRRSLIISIGGFVESKHFEILDDFDAWLRLAANHAKFKFMQEPLGAYYVGTDNLSKFNAKQFMRQKNMFDRQLNLLPSKYFDLAQSNFNYLLGSYLVALGSKEAVIFFKKIIFKETPLKWLKSRIKMLLL